MSAGADPREQSGEPPDQFLIRDLAGLKALADPLRLQILFALVVEPMTVKAVAASLGMGATRLYYHFKLLERAGLIRVASRRLVSGIEERHYVAVAESIGLAPELVPSMVNDGVVGALMRMARAELELALEARSPAPGDPDSAVPVLSFTGMALTREQVEEVQRRVEAIITDFSPGRRSPDARLYHWVFGGYLAPQEIRRADQDAP